MQLVINGHKARLDTGSSVIWRQIGLNVIENGKTMAHFHSQSPEDIYVQGLRSDTRFNTLVWLLSKLANYVAVESDSKEEATSERGLESIWLS